MFFSWQPQIELVRFKKINFAPSIPPRLEDLSEICIGSKSRSLGDTLALSTLPSKLKQKFPQLRIRTYPRAFNPVIFHGNPHVEGIAYLPDRVFGDDANSGAGHVITLKERFFGLPLSNPVRPELHLLPHEAEWARAQLAPAHERPVLIIHPWGTTYAQVASLSIWESVVKELQQHFFVLQVGVFGQLLVPGIHSAQLLTPRVMSARKLFALLSQAHAFIGVNSGPMHVARAFSVPSLALTRDEYPDQVFARRAEATLLGRDARDHDFLYADMQHVECAGQSDQNVIDAILARATCL